MSDFFKETYRQNLKLLKLSGFTWVLEQLSLLFHIYTVIADASIFVMALGTFMAIFSAEDMGKLFVSVGTFMHCMEAFLRSMYLRFQKQKFLNFVKNWNEILNENNKNIISETCADNFTKILNENNKIVNLISFVTFVSVTTLISLFNTIPIIKVYIMNMKREIDIAMWYPYNPLVPLSFEMTVVFQGLATTVAAMKSFACQSIILSLIILQATQFSHLKYSLKCICDETNYKTEFSPELKKVKYKLDYWITMSEESYRMHEQLQELTKGLFRIELISCVIVSCFATMAALVFYHTSSVAAAIAPIGLTVLKLFQLYRLCSAGDQLEMESYSVIESVYNPRWFHLKSFRGSMLIIGVRSFKPTIISAFGIFHISSPTFVAVTKLIYTFLMAILHFDTV